MPRSARFLRALLLAIATSLPALQPAGACPICARRGDAPTFVDYLMGADQIAVAKSRDGKQFEVWQVLRGDEAEVDPAPYVGKGEPGPSILLARAADTKIWRSLGPLDSKLRPFVDKALPLRPLKAALDEIWDQRLDLFEADLGDPNYQIGSSAWSIWAEAPYHILAARKTFPAPEKLRAWVADEVRPREDNLWWTLLGLHGDEPDHKLIARQLEAAWKKKDATSLAALASATLAHEGAKAIPSFKQRYLLDPERSPAEVQAVIEALSLHANESGKLRPAVIGAYREFLVARRPLAGLVARDLAAWQQWEDWPQYTAMLSSGEEFLDSSRPDIIAYLRACPEEPARLALEKLQLPEGKPESAPRDRSASPSGRK